MRHLSAERLAALADEHPTPDEAAHLAQCGQCARERDAHRLLVAGAALERDRTVAPLSSWGAISAQLRAEGIIRTPDASSAAAQGAPAPVLPFARAVAAGRSADAPIEAATPEALPAADVIPMRRRALPAWAMRAAAGLALVAGGALVGRVSAPSATSTAPTQVAAEATSPTLGAGAQPAGPVTPVANSSVTESPVYRFESTEEARAEMLKAERLYRAAMAYLAQNDSTLRPPVADPVEAYRARLAALDDAVAATRRALSLAPTDPVMNDYYLTSVSARETTLRQIDDALPVNERVTRF